LCLIAALDLRFKLKNIITDTDTHGKNLDWTITKTDNELLFDWIPADIPMKLVRTITSEIKLHYSREYLLVLDLLGIRIFATITLREITDYWECWSCISTTAAS
jgi:hypothetical protein